MMKTALIAILLVSNLAIASAEETIMMVASVESIVLTTETTPAKAALSESEIPLNVDTAKKITDVSSTSKRLAFTGFILISILGASYYMVRKYKLSNNINKSNTKIKILSQHYLGPKKSLAIIHVAGESMLIGITDQNISMIKSLSLIDDEVPSDLPQNFSDTLQLKTQRPAGASRANSTEELEEEFSFAGVKDSVSKKIKSMRSLS